MGDLGKDAAFIFEAVEIIACLFIEISSCISFLKIMNF